MVGFVLFGMYTKLSMGLDKREAPYLRDHMSVLSEQSRYGSPVVASVNSWDKRLAPKHNLAVPLATDTEFRTLMDEHWDLEVPVTARRRGMLPVANTAPGLLQAQAVGPLPPATHASLRSAPSLPLPGEPARRQQAYRTVTSGLEPLIPQQHQHSRQGLASAGQPAILVVAGGQQAAVAAAPYHAHAMPSESPAAAAQLRPAGATHGSTAGRHESPLPPLPEAKRARRSASAATMTQDDADSEELSDDEQEEQTEGQSRREDILQDSDDWQPSASAPGARKGARGRKPRTEPRSVQLESGQTVQLSQKEYRNYRRRITNRDSARRVRAQRAQERKANLQEAMQLTEDNEQLRTANAQLRQENEHLNSELDRYGQALRDALAREASMKLHQHTAGHLDSLMGGHASATTRQVSAHLPASRAPHPMSPELSSSEPFPPSHPSSIWPRSSSVPAPQRGGHVRMHSLSQLASSAHVPHMPPHLFQDYASGGTAASEGHVPPPREGLVSQSAGQAPGTPVPSRDSFMSFIDGVALGPGQSLGTIPSIPTLSSLEFLPDLAGQFPNL